MRGRFSTQSCLRVQHVSLTSIASRAVVWVALYITSIVFEIFDRGSWFVLLPLLLLQSIFVVLFLGFAAWIEVDFLSEFLPVQTSRYILRPPILLSHIEEAIV